VTDFFDYMQPFPDVGHLASNVRWFVGRHAIGLNEEGAHNSKGSDLAPLKTYVLSRAMWDPHHANGSRLADEFGAAYYGRDAWPHLREYSRLFEARADEEGAYVSEHDDCRASWLAPVDVLHAAALFKAAAASAAGGAGGAAVIRRVETAKMSVWFLLLARWDEVRAFAANQTIAWPAEAEKADALIWFERVWNASGAVAWDEKGNGLDYLKSCTREGETCYC
jgi:hypothetical protein